MAVSWSRVRYETLTPARRARATTSARGPVAPARTAISSVLRPPPLRSASTGFRPKRTSLNGAESVGPAWRVLDRPSKLVDRVTQLVGAPPVTPLACLAALADETVDLGRRARGVQAPREETQRTAQALQLLDPGVERLLMIGRLRALEMPIEGAREVEQGAERLRGIEVVVHRRVEASTEAAQRFRDRPRWPRVAVRLAEETVEALERATCLGQPLLRELDRVAVVCAEEPETQRVGVVTLHQLADEQRVDERLGHLLGAQIHEPVVDPVVRERLSGRRLQLCDLALVVREDQILAPTMHVERRAEIFHRHGRALDVPAGASVTPRTRPRRLARLGRRPQGDIALVTFALVHFDAGAGEQLVEVLAGQTTVGGKPR